MVKLSPGPRLVLEIVADLQRAGRAGTGVAVGGFGVGVRVGLLGAGVLVEEAQFALSIQLLQWPPQLPSGLV